MSTHGCLIGKMLDRQLQCRVRAVDVWQELDARPASQCGDWMSHFLYHFSDNQINPKHRKILQNILVCDTYGKQPLGCSTHGFKFSGRRGRGVRWCQYLYTVKQQNKQLHVIYLPSVSVCVYRRMKFKGCGHSLYNHLPWAATCGHRWWTLPENRRAFMVATSVRHEIPANAYVSQQRWANPS